jgi:hypothetical protein
MQPQKEACEGNFHQGFPNIRSVLLIHMADRTAGLQAQKNY